jgi:hypothetical protein
VKNLNGKNRPSHDGDFLSDTARIVERYTFTDAEHMTYEATIDDPRVFTRLEDRDSECARSSGQRTTWESACHEGERRRNHAAGIEITLFSPQAIRAPLRGKRSPCHSMDQ